MSRLHLLAASLVALGAATAVLLGDAAPAAAHARYERSEPPAGATIDGVPFVLRAWFSQELMLRSTIAVVDEAGNLVDLGDGRVDEDDPDRKAMVVSLPALPPGTYSVNWTAVSAEDGDAESGTFTFTVGAPVSATDLPPSAMLIRQVRP
jgi:methionine-rich copper-binding protein CopC